MRKDLPTSIDLFGGAGGMSLGFEQAGFNVLASFDIEEFNTLTHQANFRNCRAVQANLATETGESLRKLANFENKEIDVVFGGPPCQGFSVGGHRETDDERNQLVYHFARLVRQIEPKYFVMENVKGLMGPHAKPILASLIRRIKLSGYQIVEPIRVLNAADYGVPQRRYRTIILGYRKGLKAPEYPEPRGYILVDGTPFHPVVRDAITDLPKVEDYEDLFETDKYDHELSSTDNPYALLMRGSLRDAQDLSPNRRKRIGITGCFRTTHSPDTVKRFRATKQGNPEPVSRYFRLAWDEVAPTIRAGTGQDRGSHTAPRPIHPERPRCITVREAARLHSLPDWFRFHGTRWHDFRQIGNSVPPLLARAVAQQIIEKLR